MAKRRKRQRGSLDPAIKEVRRRKLEFERHASYILSTALGFEVTVKVKPQRIAPPKAAGGLTHVRKVTKREAALSLWGLPPGGDKLPIELLP